MRGASLSAESLCQQIRAIARFVLNEWDNGTARAVYVELRAAQNELLRANEERSRRRLHRMPDGPDQEGDTP